jgi:hypothetical protein
MGIGYGPRLTTRENPAPSVSWIMSNYDYAKDGYYWIDFDTIGPQFVYCILDINIHGGGWMGLNSTISPQIANANNTNAYWVSNRSRRVLRKDNLYLIQASIREIGCGNNSHYTLKSPNDYGVSYTESMLLMERVSTYGQCSTIVGKTSAGYFTGPEYTGTYTSSSMCTWGDGNFANNCCGAQNMTGLELYWVILGSGTNHELKYSVACAGGSGTHYHMWFIK